MKDFVELIVPVLAQINIFSNVSPGERSVYFGATSDEDAIKVGTLLCFDSIYETLGIDVAREGAEMIIIPSNDSWFYDSRALNMHHAQNILRAVEQRKYVVNCGNTGLTSIVNEKGEVIKKMPIYTEGYVLDTVYASSGRTIYSYIGNLFVYLCILLVLSPLAYAVVLKYRK
jgi:apolipoprotein N-acyltransferase